MSRAARLGAFIVATLAILVAGVFIIGSRQYLFSSTYQLKAQFDNVVGLDAGGDVRVGGVHSGTVRSIALPHKPGEKVTIVMDLGKSTHEIIKQDSVASIETEGLLGNQYMAISFGSAGMPGVRDGDTLASLPPLEMSDLLKNPAAFWTAPSKLSRTPLRPQRISIQYPRRSTEVREQWERWSTTSSSITTLNKRQQPCVARWSRRKQELPGSRRIWKH